MFTPHDFTEIKWIDHNGNDVTDMYTDDEINYIGNLIEQEW